MAHHHPHKSNGGLMLLGGLGLGALVMYLADPQAGRRRRARLVDQYQHTSLKVQRGADVVLRDARNRAEGFAAQVRSYVPRLGARGNDDAILVERIRSALGRATSHPHAVEVACESGHVTLRGVALASETPRIMSAARHCRGVKSVTNHLIQHESAEGIPALQGGHPREGRIELMQDNWSPAWRSLAGAIGAGLTFAGWIRGGFGGLALGAVGGGLVARAAANRDLKSLVGARSADHGGIVVQKAIHVDAPVEDVYGHWTIESFPHWMSHVRRVTPLGENRHHWVVDGPADMPVEWESETYDIVENERMSWRSVPGSTVDNAGCVRFMPENGGTRVQVTICYMPPGGVIGHAVAKALGSDPKSRMDDDLMRFKSMIETGTIPHDAAARRPSSGDGAARAGI
jgi:uncharacterized membrane protein